MAYTMNYYEQVHNQMMALNQQMSMLTGASYNGLNSGAGGSGSTPSNIDSAVQDFWATSIMDYVTGTTLKNKRKDKQKELFLRLIDNKNRGNCSKVQLKEERWLNPYQRLETVELVDGTTLTTTTATHTGTVQYTRTNGWISPQYYSNN